MAIYISVISHGHYEIINELSCLSLLSSEFNIIIKSNKPNDVFGDWIDKPNVHWIDEQYGYGFGKNNNLVFNYCKLELGMKSEDYFIVLNPDVIINSSELEKLVHMMTEHKIMLSSINLFKDEAFSSHDNSIRRFPSATQFFSSFMGMGNSSIIDKRKLAAPTYVDWAAGSFLAFRAQHYEKLNGFDESYFMYCEDIDICYRSYLSGVRVLYYPEIKAIHLAKHANRHFLSKHFYWHVRSVVKYLLRKYFINNPNSTFI